MKRIKSIVTLIFIGLFIVIISKPGYAETDTIEIKTAEDLHQLSIDASFDQWSIGKTVILQADIDLNNENFAPIPIFEGTFDGNGYTISGLYIEGEGSSQGLFRHLGQRGYIKDLNIRGRILPGGDRYIVGGLVGHNEGTIENSKLTAIVKGRDTVGGLVGFNGSMGKIINSTFNGYIQGQREVGGIAGYNTGTIIRSINKAQLNPIIHISNQYYSDIGGITGVNIGVIDGGKNTGTIGYESIGYNIGGIAGRQSGYITDSINYGEVFGKESVGGIVGKMEPYENLIIPPSKLEELKDEIEVLESHTDKLISNAGTRTSGIDDSLSSLQRNINNSRTHLRSLLSQLEKGTDIDAYRRAKGSLFTSLNSISSSISSINSDINLENDIVVEDMENVNDGFFQVSELLMTIIEELAAGELETEDIVMDISTEVINSNREGTVSDSINHGTIQGDTNVGGIGGSMSFILAFNPKIDLDAHERLTINTVLETQSIIRGAENTGKVISRLNNVGGILGNMEHGYISNSLSLATIESRSGDYIGGIVGKSNGRVESSYAKTTLKGRDYIGGIAGLGKEIIDSYSLIEIHKYNSYIGAIAGDVDEDSTIEENYFVSDSLNGIDGISYAGHAEPMDYDDFISSGDIAENFQDFKLSFKRDNKLVDTLTVEYGDSLSEEDMPRIPSKDGYYGRWEEFDKTNIRMDREIHAQYVPYLTILESEERRDHDLSIVTVEGKFKEEDSLALNKIDLFVEEEEQEPLEQWRLTIPNDGQASHTIRYYPPDEYRNLEVYVRNNEHWIKTDSKWEGNYLVFESSTNNTMFRLVEGQPTMEYLILAFILVFGLAFIVVKIYGKWESKRRGREGAF